MRRHKRDIVQAKARIKVAEAIEEIRQKHDLTDIELLQILVGEQQSILKYSLREERHGDPNKPAGIE